MVDWMAVYERLRAYIQSGGVTVDARPLGFETTGVFDGLSITTNSTYDLETCCYNLAHSFGHIAQWSLDYPRFQKLYEDLHAAKAHKAADPEALRRALEQFRAYEEEASAYAVWLLAETGNADVVPGFTVFARADIEAIVGFHRDGIAPVWHAFFAAWQRRRERGEVDIAAFAPKSIPAFTPLPIEPQEVIQEVDGQ